MSIVGIITAMLRQSGIDPGAGAIPGSALRRGWDYWVPKRPPDHVTAAFDPVEAFGWDTTKPDNDGNGMARTPHLLLRAEALPQGSLPVLDVSMDVRQLLAGIWRQCLIRPSDSREPEGDNPFVVADPEDVCASSEHLIALLGHSPRDLALWLDDLRRQDASLFRLVLAKDFRAAIIARPGIVEEPWPGSVRELWSASEGDYLPPFLVAVLYAELGRLAMNQAGLLALAFDGRVELTTKQLLERIGTSGGPASTQAADRAIDLAPFQSLALGPPDLMIKEKDTSAIEAWVQTASSSIALSAGLRGDIDISPKTSTEAEFVRVGFAAHPQFQKEPRKNKGWSLQPRRAGFFWGLHWRLNAAVRLLEIARTARQWNVAHRPGGPRLPDAAHSKTANPVACAIAAIRFRWVVEHSPAAGLTVLGELLSKEDKDDLEFDTWTPDQIDPLTIDGYLGRKSGLDMLKQAWAQQRLLPKPGEFGYTARSQAHLWIDAVGDDIDHYHRFHADALRGHADAVGGRLRPELQDTCRAPAEVVALLGHQLGAAPKPGIGHNRPPLDMTSDLTAVVGAQLTGQAISPLSTDPILARLLRRK